MEKISSGRPRAPKPYPCKVLGDPGCRRPRTSSPQACKNITGVRFWSPWAAKTFLFLKKILKKFKKIKKIKIDRGRGGSSGGPGISILHSESRIQNSDSRIQNPEFWIQNGDSRSSRPAAPPVNF